MHQQADTPTSPSPEPFCLGDLQFPITSGFGLGNKVTFTVVSFKQTRSGKPDKQPIKVQVTHLGLSTSMCVFERDRERDIKRECKRAGDRDSNFSIDITDFTHQAPNCLNTLKEARRSDKASVLCQQRLKRFQLMTDFYNCFKSFCYATV